MIKKILDRFFNGICGYRKGHQLDNFGELKLTARQTDHKGTNPFATVFFFYRVFPKKSRTGNTIRKEVILLHTSLETTDIFRGAFFICMGGDLEDIRFNNRQIASFMFQGKDLHKHDKNYISGHALVNPVQFREALNSLRDILFEHLRKETRYDRKRSDRTHQNQCRH